MTRRAAVALLALLASGCGFQLRRWDVGSAFQSVRINAERGVDLDRDLRQALESAGVAISEDADVTVSLARQRAERRSAATTRTGRTAEYELSLQIQFAVAGAEGEEIAQARVLRSERVVRLDQDHIVGSSEEQALVEREMRADLVQRMMRALGTLSRARSAAGSD